MRLGGGQARTPPSARCTVRLRFLPIVASRSCASTPQIACAVRATSAAKIEAAQDEVVRLLQSISRRVAMTESPTDMTQDKLDEMASDLSFKRSQMDHSVSTSERLQHELQQRKVPLRRRSCVEPARVRPFSCFLRYPASSRSFTAHSCFADTRAPFGGRPSVTPRLKSRVLLFVGGAGRAREDRDSR